MSNKKGELHLFVSYAPGVGKTYHMLKAVKEEEKENKKVFYAHIYGGHRETEEERNGYTIREILECIPDVVVMDEMVMVGRNKLDDTKRICDDIEVLLDLGFDVYSTVNMFHFSGVDRECRDRTGFKVKKPLCDDWIEGAESVTFIDYDPENLIRNYEGNTLFTKVINKGKVTDTIFKLENLRLYREESLKLLKKFSNIKYIKRESRSRERYEKNV